jgi:hypothetical protein
MKSYKVKYLAPLAAAGAAALGLVAANSTPAPAADMAVYGTKKKANKTVYGKKPYGAEKKMPYGTIK